MNFAAETQGSIMREHVNTYLRTGLCLGVAPPREGVPPNLTASKLKEHSVIEAQPQLWHPRQKHLQLDGAHNLAEQDTAISIDLQRGYPNMGCQQVQSPPSCPQDMRHRSSPEG